MIVEHESSREMRWMPDFYLQPRNALSPLSFIDTIGHSYEAVLVAEHFYPCAEGCIWPQGSTSALWLAASALDRFERGQRLSQALKVSRPAM